MRGERSQKLTPREVEIIAQLKHGRSNREIAAELGIAQGTVKVHLRSVLLKTGCRTRLQAATRE